MDPSIPLWKQGFRQQAPYVLKQGVLWWGLPLGISNFLWQSYKAGAWIPVSESLVLIGVFALMGIPFGLHQLRNEKFHDPTKRCAECGEADPGHTSWCSRK